MFKKHDDSLIDFLNSVLVYEPEKRVSPLKSLLNSFFDDLYKPDFIDNFDGLAKLPNLFNFTEEEILYDPETVNLIKSRILNNK